MNGLTVLRYLRGGGALSKWGWDKLRQRNRLKTPQNPQRRVRQERAGLIFHARNRPVDLQKYTPKRQSNKPYKAVATRNCCGPEVHRGCRSN